MTAKSPHHNTSWSPRTAATRTVPSTVWPSETGPLTPGDRWPGPILSRAVHEFSTVGDRVLLAASPAPTAGGRSAVTPPDTASALATIESLGREGRIACGVRNPGQSAELVLVSLLAEDPDPVAAADQIAELALARLTEGGLLVVLSRCGHSSDGVLSDPGGSVVAAAQAADLLYLQHIIAVPVHGDSISTHNPQTPEAPAPASRPARHAVAHTDLFAFLRVGQQHSAHDTEAAA